MLRVVALVAVLALRGRQLCRELVLGRHICSAMVASLSVLGRALSVDDCLEAVGFLGTEKLDGLRWSTDSDLDFITACAGRGISGTSGMPSSSSFGSSLNLGSLGSSLPGM